MKTICHILGSLTKPVRRALGSSGGFTLVEVLVSVTILTIVTGIFGAGMFQLLSIQRFWIDDINATREARHASDVLDAGGVARLTCTPSPSVQQVTLTWTEVSGTPHSVVYSVSGDELLRDFDNNGIPLTMASGVVPNSISFTLCGNTLRAKMDVLADRGGTESLDLLTYMRKLN